MRAAGAGMLLLVALAATACTAGGAARDRASAPPSAPVLRTDAAALATCVALPAKAQKVSWTSHPLGATGSREVGPTDFRLEGIAWLADGEAARLHGSGTWHAPVVQVPAQLSALLGQDDGGWVQQDAPPGSGPSAPDYLLDPGTGVLYFWAENPHCAS
ncbi:hypothetical protein ACFYNO_04785 [Kitasatospora sp. NPDC006697]|uniref:hypothetical protein n=1 Tax=Kitasatospora sp. NPDC006697 TaxID=3364020 RepID=UPI0036A893FC